MIAVMFEVWPRDGYRQAYLDVAAQLRPLLDEIDGFISIERFESLSEPGKILSLSFWRDERAVAAWRRLEKHRAAQSTQSGWGVGIRGTFVGAYGVRPPRAPRAGGFTAAARTATSQADSV